MRFRRAAFGGTRVAAGAAILVWITSAGCLVTRATWEREVARAELAEATAQTRAERIGQLSQRVSDLEKTGETLELERTSLEQERLDLIESVEDLRTGNELLNTEIAQERRLRQQREAEATEVSATYKDLVEELEKEVRAGHVEIHRLRGRLQVRALEGILFDSGSAKIKPQGADVLAKIATQVTQIPRHRIQIEGHTDPVPIATDRFPSNWELSASRAARVVRFLVDQGLDPTRLSAVGLGPFQPIADNDTNEGRAQNRRIEIVLVPEEEE